MVYLFSLVVPLMSLGVMFTDNVFIILSPLLYIFVVIPFLDTLPVKMKKTTINDDLLDMFLFAVCFLYLAVLAVFLILAPTMDTSLLMLRAISSGLSGGVIAINCAHELGHRNSAWSHRLAKLLLFTTSYTHFFIEHNKGHHKWVATEHDPATSRFGESLYAFFPRTIIQSAISAFNIEKKKHGILKNEVLYYFILLFLFYCILFSISFKCAVGFLIHSLVSIILLESVNYIEHYGIMRKKKNGRYEKVTPIHSWNSDHLFSRIHLFELSRHSHHHAQANVPFYKLESIEDSPQMPYGYAGMILLAFVPPLWFKVMNKRVTQAQKA